MRARKRGACNVPLVNALTRENATAEPVGNVRPRAIPHGFAGSRARPACSSRQRREERPVPELGDLQFYVARRGRDQLRAMPVALRGPSVAALMRSSADGRGQLGLDQLLETPGQQGADGVIHVARLDGGEQVGQVKLGEGHGRGLLRVIPARNTPSITPVAHPKGGPTPIYTTSGDATVRVAQVPESGTGTVRQVPESRCQA